MHFFYNFFFNLEISQCQEYFLYLKTCSKYQSVWSDTLKFYCYVLVHRYFTEYASEGTTEQVHSWTERGGSECHQEVPALCRQGVCDPKCGDGLIQEKEVRTPIFTISA